MPLTVALPCVPMESTDSLNSNGAFVFPVRTPTDGFTSHIRQCTNDWFHANFKLMLDEPLPVMFKGSKPPYAPKPDLIASAEEWNTLTDERKTYYRTRIDLTTDKGMSMAFDTSFLDKEFKKEPLLSMPGKKYFRQAIIYTKQGNSGVAMGTLVSKAWTKAGFGMWAHICPDASLGMVVDAMHMMEKLGLSPGLPNHFPHAIYKPPSGTPLEVHHDQMAPRNLLQNLREHVASADSSMSAWVAKHGIQMLAHLHGGTGISNGATFVVGPMTPTKMLICLETLEKVSRDGDYEKWMAKADGIHYLNVEKYLPEFNKALQQAGFDPVGMVPIAPTDPGAFSGGFGLGFPVGMWHGSFSNAGEEDQMNGKGSRLTITLPLTLRNATQVPDSRIPTRLRAMATVSMEGLTVDEYKRAGEWLANDLKEYASGSTHSNPERILDFVCCSDAAKVLGRKVGPYFPISVKPQSVANYLDVLNRIERGESLTLPSTDQTLMDDVPMEDAPQLLEQPSSAPPSLDVLTDTDVRLIKVKQPWAEALVTGKKNVENRNWHLTPSTGFPAWVLVVASKSAPTGPYMKDYVARLTLQGGPGATGPGPVTQEKDEFVLGKIVGIIRVVGCFTQASMPVQSVWYNPPDIGWVVDQAWPFDDPIDLHPRDMFQTQVSLKHREIYLPRVKEEMMKLEPKYM